MIYNVQAHLNPRYGVQLMTKMQLLRFLKQTSQGSLPRIYLLIHYISREGHNEAF